MFTEKSPWAERGTDRNRGKMASERRTEAQDRAKAATGSACYSGKVYKNVPDEVCAVRYR